MTREENLHWIDQEIQTWENECQSKHPIKEALYAARKALERELNTWSLDDAREDFMYDVYNILDFLPTNDEANRIIDIFDMVTKGIKQEQDKPMVEIDLYSVIKQKYIEREVLDKIRAEIDKARFIDKDTRIVKNALASGLEVAMQIIDKYKAESEVKE